MLLKFQIKVIPVSTVIVPTLLFDAPYCVIRAEASSAFERLADDDAFIVVIIVTIYM